MFKKVAKRLGGLVSLLWREIIKFGAVGGVAYVIDSTLFLFLREGALSHKTLTAGVIASVVATVFSWMANRYWTFRHRRRSGVMRELMMFAIMNAIGIGIATFCLFISHYVLGYQTTHADFIAKNVIGLVLGTIFRFIAYRYWVFSEELAEDPAFADPPGAPRPSGGPRLSGAPRPSGSRQPTPGKGAVKGGDRHRTGA